jgi:hypothetical protein
MNLKKLRQWQTVEFAVISRQWQTVEFALFIIQPAADGAVPPRPAKPLSLSDVPEDEATRLPPGKCREL